MKKIHLFLQDFLFIITKEKCKKQLIQTVEQKLEMVLNQLVLMVFVRKIYGIMILLNLLYVLLKIVTMKLKNIKVLNIKELYNH